MNVQSIDLVWIAVKDLKQAVKFYTETVGLKLVEINEKMGWAEVQGHAGGMRLGIAQISNADSELQVGENACLTFSVANLEKAIEEAEKKGATMVGDIEEIPGHAKMQASIDSDGNLFQLVQKLS